MSRSIDANIQKMIEASPIASWLGFSASHFGEQNIYRLAFDEKHIGNPAIRALHGGAIATFLEVAAQCELVGGLDTGASIKTINADINYLASSRAQAMEGSATITRLGRRIAFVEATGWQQSADRPVAKGMFRFRIGTDN
ncbi:MAG: PaaI family thioesterase [Pseudomonadota bacterium]